MSTADLPVYPEPNSGDRLLFTIFIAVAFHIVLLYVTFADDPSETVAPRLNITLATHDNKTAPEKVDFIAQFNQEASGTEAEVKELTTKAEAEIQDVRIREVNPIPEQQARDKSERERRLVTTTGDSAQRLPQQAETQSDDEAAEELDGEAIDAPLVNPEFASLQAKLDKLRQDLARQPRIRRLTSVSTKAAHDALYLNQWAEKVEAVGNKNFPEVALRDEIFGSLRLSVMILPDGRVEQIEILQSSGQVVLDEAAVQIVKLASPFNPFPREIQKTTDKLEIIRTWRFEITGLRTTR